MICNTWLLHLSRALHHSLRTRRRLYCTLHILPVLHCVSRVYDCRAMQVSYHLRAHSHVLQITVGKHT